VHRLPKHPYHAPHRQLCESLLRAEQPRELLALVFDHPSKCLNLRACARNSCTASIF
jgi:hypothetical protein